MLLVYNYVLLKMSTWCSKHVEESNNILRINNIQCNTLVILYGQFMMHGQRDINSLLMCVIRIIRKRTGLLWRILKNLEKSWKILLPPISAPIKFFYCCCSDGFDFHVFYLVFYGSIPWVNLPTLQLFLSHVFVALILVSSPATERKCACPSTETDLKCEITYIHFIQYSVWRHVQRLLQNDSST